MNAVIMDNVEIGPECVIGAAAFVPAGTRIPARKVAVGNPVKIVKDVSDEMLKWKTDGTKIYQRLPASFRDGWKEVEPLRELPLDRPKQSAIYKTWREIKGDS
jgi:carbonic anhydrase/acetyltransferase-like protein (isoleucine patch superfamily)